MARAASLAVGPFAHRSATSYREDIGTSGITRRLTDTTAIEKVAP